MLTLRLLSYIPPQWPTVGVAAFDHCAAAAAALAARGFLDLLVVRPAKRAQVLQPVSRAWLGQVSRPRDNVIGDGRGLDAGWNGAAVFVALQRLAAQLAPEPRAVEWVVGYSDYLAAIGGKSAPTSCGSAHQIDAKVSLGWQAGRELTRRTGVLRSLSPSSRRGRATPPCAARDAG